MNKQYPFWRPKQGEDVKIRFLDNDVKLMYPHRIQLSPEMLSKVEPNVVDARVLHRIDPQAIGIRSMYYIRTNPNASSEEIQQDLL